MNRPQPDSNGFMNISGSIPVYVNDEHLMDVLPEIGRSGLSLLVRNPDGSPAVDSQGYVRTTKAVFVHDRYECRDSGVRIMQRRPYDENRQMLVAR